MPGYVPDSGKYEAARRGISDRYGTESATNAYGRFLSQQRGSRQLSDSTRNFNRSMPGFTARFGARGLSGPNAQSGVMQRSMQNYVGDHYRNQARMGQDMTNELQGYDLGQSQLDAWRQSSLADLELQRTQDIASAAANLEALKTYFGGF